MSMTWLAGIAAAVEQAEQQAQMDQPN